MRVRRLEINGFKSFADRTVVDFPEAMCAVVGPNGCGKSNVVDAVRWVLGEQSAKQLRGQAMEDVIFAGAESRQASGAAEVSLVFENNGSVSHPQFADLPEIMITRRLFRSGDSDYLINKMPCRLKDIQQLLMDTGLGNRAYAIIEQGRVAAFIEAKPEERRLWVEEAAGITRYKNQKKVSLRKMQAATENLERLGDILHEVETQMARLQRQAKKAQRHKELRSRIRELDLNLQSHEYQRLTSRIQEVDSEAEAVGAQLLLANQRVTGLETDLETMKVQLVQAESEISQAGQRRLEAQGAIQKAENELSLLGREAENLRRLAERYRAERTELTERLKGQERELARARGQAQRGQQAQEAGQARLDQAARRSQELSGRVRQAEARVEEAREQVVDGLSRASQAKNRLADLERSRAELLRRREQTAGREQAAEAEIAEQEQKLQARQEALAGLKAELAQAEEGLAGLGERREEGRRRLAELEAAEKEAVRAAERLAAKDEALAAGLASYDWARSGVREVLAAKREGRLPVEILGLVAERLSVAPGWEPVLEAALGADLQAVVAPDAAAARALAAWVEEQEAGRVKVLALDELALAPAQPPAGAEALGRAVTPEPGCEALLALVAGAGRSPDLDAAWEAGRALTPGQRLVTPAGQRLDSPGAALVGVRSGEAGSSVLAKKNELAQVRQELAQAREEARLASLERQRAESELADLDEEHAALTAARGEREKAVRAAEQEVWRLGEELGAARRRLEGLGFDSDEIEAELDRSAGEEKELSAALEEAAGSQAQLEEALSTAQAELAQAREELEEARSAEGEARLEAANQASRAQHAQAEARRLAKEMEASQERVQALAAEISGAEESLASLTRRREELQASLGSRYQALDQEEAAHRQAKEVLSQAQMKSSDLEGSLKQARAEQRRVEERSGELSLRRKELAMQRDNVCEQAMERCRVDLTHSHAEHLPQGSFDPEATRERLAKLRTRLNNLGPVNMEAISEHEALAERHEFLTAQKADLEDSLEDLRSAIRKINKTSRSRFTDTLELVNQRLGEVFPVLFGGGRAELKLDEDVDPLDAGLHLMVELPGKRLRNIEALSGGEKAMSAAAVLFALFLIRPAPFCILDEVDAPLDEANVGRFHDLLRDLAKRSQILMVTHSRRTMEIMDVLYGVTMEDKGVSKLLSVDLQQGESLAA
jgi:chromosome segregation protein